MYSFFAKIMCKSVLVCLYIITMNRNGNIVSMRPKSSVDSVQERIYYIFSPKGEFNMGVLFALLDGAALGFVVYATARPHHVARMLGLTDHQSESEEGGEE